MGGGGRTTVRQAGARASIGGLDLGLISILEPRERQAP